MQIDNNKRIEIKAMEVVAFILEQYDKEKIDKDLKLNVDLNEIKKTLKTFRDKKT